MQAVVLREFGGPEVLRCEEVPTPTPGLGEVLVHVHAVSVNRTLCTERGQLVAFFNQRLQCHVDQISGIVHLKMWDQERVTGYNARCC